MYLVSACLAGLCTRYDGASRPEPRIIKMVKEGRAIPVCPEQLGGLPTPRPPVEFSTGAGAEALNGTARLLTPEGEDRTAAIIKCAHAVLALAKKFNIKQAILKDGSPSCGVTYVHRAGVGKVPGRGVTAEFLSSHGIEVLGVNSI